MRESPSRSALRPAASRALPRTLVLLLLGVAASLSPSSCKYLEATEKPCQAAEDCIFPFVCCGATCAEYKSCQSAPAALIAGNPCQRQRPDEVATLERGVPQTCGRGLVCCLTSLTCAPNDGANNPDGYPAGCPPIHPAVDGGDAPCRIDGDCVSGAICCGINLASRNGRCTSVEKCGGVSGDPPDRPPVGGSGGSGGGATEVDCKLTDLPLGTTRPDVCLSKGVRAEDGLVGYWAIDEDGYLCDLSGLAHDGSVQGFVQGVPGAPQAAAPSAALALDNANTGFLQLPVRDARQPSEPASYGLFFRPEITGSQTAVLLSRGVFREGVTADSFDIGITPCGAVALHVQLGETAVDQSSPCGVAPNGTWSHFAAAFDDTSVAVYVAGQRVLTAVLPREPSFPCVDSRVGASQRFMATTSFRGAVDDIKFWKRTLPAAEVCAQAGGVIAGEACTLP